MRRAATFFVVAIGTAVGSLWWLHEGDLAEAVEPVVAEWDADLLARDAGIVEQKTDESGSEEGQDAPDALPEEPDATPSE